MADGEAFVIRAAGVRDLGRTDGGSFRLVQRDDLGLGDLSIGMSDNPPGTPGFTHRHSCGEVFVVVAGRGRYTVGDVEVVAEPGDMVIIPPSTWHSFCPDGDSSLRHVAVYDSGQVDIELSTGQVISKL